MEAVKRRYADRTAGLRKRTPPGWRVLNECERRGNGGESTGLTPPAQFAKEPAMQAVQSGPANPRRVSYCGEWKESTLAQVSRKVWHGDKAVATGERLGLHADGRSAVEPETVGGAAFVRGKPQGGKAEVVKREVRHPPQAIVRLPQEIVRGARSSMGAPRGTRNNAIVFANSIHFACRCGVQRARLGA